MIGEFLFALLCLALIALLLRFLVQLKGKWTVVKSFQIGFIVLIVIILLLLLLNR
jgi:hypothetical protein